MEELLKELQNSLLEAMKSKDTAKSGILRMVISDIKSEQLNTGADMKLERAYKIIQSHVNSMKEAAEQYAQVGKKEARENELTQIAILEKYLPASMPEAEVEKIVSETVKETGASGMQDMGKVMGAVMAKLAGKADGSVIQKIVKDKLST
jgi:uncharacterized protein